MLRGVVQCLEAGEVDGGLDLDRVAREAFVLDGDLHGRIRLLASERGAEAVLREHRRVDALREIAERLERFRHDVAGGLRPCRVPAAGLDGRACGRREASP